MCIPRICTIACNIVCTPTFGEYILDYERRLIRCSVLYQCVLGMCADGLERVVCKFWIRSYKWLSKPFELSMKDVFR